MKASSMYILLIAALLAGCGASPEQITATAEMAKAQTQTAAPTLTPTFTPTITPTSTPSATPTPDFVSVYESKALGLSLKYPTGWDVDETSENSMGQITIRKNDKHIDLYFFPASAQQQNDNNPVTSLVSYITFVGYSQPDKEMIHIINLGDSEFAFGSYNEPGGSPDLFSSPSPSFIAMHFTKTHTIAIEFHAPPGDEEENKEIFALILNSLPPSPPRTVVATPTLAPSIQGKLPELPQGFNWQGVENIDLALPMPDGWFVKFIKYSEAWQNGLQEYQYQYVITQENPDYVGSFSPALGIMQVYAFKSKNSDANDTARQYYNNLKNSDAITKVIEDQVTEQGNVIAYQVIAESTNPGVAAGDPGSNQTFSTIFVSNKKTNILYILTFASATESWDQEWVTGEVMIQALMELLQR